MRGAKPDKYAQKSRYPFGLGKRLSC
jgi:hypothetical protein